MPFLKGGKIKTSFHVLCCCAHCFERALLYSILHTTTSPYPSLLLFALNSSNSRIASMERAFIPPLLVALQSLWAKGRLLRTEAYTTHKSEVKSQKKTSTLGIYATCANIFVVSQLNGKVLVHFLTITFLHEKPPSKRWHFRPAKCDFFGPPLSAFVDGSLSLPIYWTTDRRNRVVAPPPSLYYLLTEVWK